ncbi:MAG TPA: YiiD C-terminal domain-containing protein [Lysobacter sp.]|nr:YiiD C-terminal domain-containing protein [Lysobacter sp.]
MPYSDALQRLEHHFRSMPPVVAMEPQIRGYDGQRLQLSAPLARHVNDKGSAFGGSLASLMTLASWALVSLKVEAAGIDAEIYVADSQIRYLLPVFDDLHVTAELASPAAAPKAGWDGFIATLRQRGRARTTLVARVPLADGRIATDFTARYVAIVR